MICRQITRHRAGETRPGLSAPQILIRLLAGFAPAGRENQGGGVAGRLLALLVVIASCGRGDGVIVHYAHGDGVIGSSLSFPYHPITSTRLPWRSDQRRPSLSRRH